MHIHIQKFKILRVELTGYCKQCMFLKLWWFYWEWRPSNFQTCTWREETIVLLFEKFTYSEKGSLKKHIDLVHEGKKPYGCPTCNKAFGRSQTLKDHILSVHEKNSHKCSFCDLSLTSLQNLRRHIKYVHEVKFIICWIYLNYGNMGIYLWVVNISYKNAKMGKWKILLFLHYLKK